VGENFNVQQTTIKKMEEIGKEDQVLDIGPETQADFGAIIARAKMIIWNGPVGYMENPHFRRGTDFLYYAITQNRYAVSVIGGGDTLAAINNKEYLEKITHISMGGGAMLEFIENGTLAGIEALKKTKHNS
jgi:phosphoglycerate kinase